MKEQLKVTNATTRLTILLFIVYLVIMCWILLFKLGVRFSYMENRSANFTPFNEHVLTGENILNIVIFVPIGVYAAILFTRWSFHKKLFLFFSLSLIVEGLQYIFRIGAFDVTDIITNTLGGMLGLILFKTIERIFNNHFTAQKLINIIAATGSILMLLLLVLLKMNMLPIKYQ